METKNNTLQNWINELEKEIKASNLLSFDIDNINSLRIMKDDFISLFNDVVQGKKLKICKLDNFMSLSQAISLYQKDHELNGNEIFTNLNEDVQQTVLKSIKENSDKAIKDSAYTNAYLGFGLMRYNLDVFSQASKLAPLVFVPITLLYNQETDTYFIKGVKGEVYLNTVLFDRIKKVRRLDLSYPVDSNFSIGDFLYYISIKIQSLNWNVSNHVFISNFDLFKYNDFLDIRDKQDVILSHEIVKKVSYFNSQFYNFSYQNRVPLDSKYLSVLDMDNDEYSILKRVSARDNLFIRTGDVTSRTHLISNIILSYILNNRKALVVYANNEDKDELLKYIDTQGYINYVADLNPLSLNKEDLIANIVNYDNYLLPYRKSKEMVINDDIQRFYDYKNDYKKLTNSLRTMDNPLHMSLNKLINEYYKYDNLPLIDISIHEPNKFSSDELTRYIDFVGNFAKAITKLSVAINEHPFYGFNARQMRKDDYSLLKKETTKSSALLHDILSLINVGVKKYLYPNPTTLFEIKALLNVLSFIDEYEYKKEWINDITISKAYEELVKIRNKIEELNKYQQNMIDKYSRKILFIQEDLVNEYLESHLPKTKAKIRKLLGGKNVPLDSIDTIIDELNYYYISIHEVKEETSHHDDVMVEMMRNNELDKLHDIIYQIVFFRKNLKSIKDKNGFDVLNYIGNKDINRQIHRKALQNAYNELLKSTKIIQSYFNENQYKFDEFSLDKYEEKMTLIATNFISINDYTDFFKSLLEANDFISNLGNELIKAGDPQDFKKIFIKRFYYDLINERIISNINLKENTREKIYEDLSNFASSDEKRKEMITSIISNNIDTYLKKNILRLRHDESDNIYHLFSKQSKMITMNMITSSTKESLYLTRPCMMTSYKNVSKFLLDPLFKFDIVIFLPNKNMSMVDILPSLVHAENSVVFDEEYISTDPRKNIQLQEASINNNFIDNARYSYHASTYKSDARNIILYNSPLDENVKKHIAKVLESHGIDVKTDVQEKNYIIDILAKLPESKNTIAIELNHLPYNSPEDAFK